MIQLPLLALSGYYSPTARTWVRVETISLSKRSAGTVARNRLPRSVRSRSMPVFGRNGVLALQGRQSPAEPSRHRSSQSPRRATRHRCDRADRAGCHISFNPHPATAICARCLQRDIDRGRAPYVRRAWTHPLAVFCAEHGVPLAPHGHSPIKIASELTFFDVGSSASEPRDAMWETADFDVTAMVQRVWRALGADTGARRLEHRLRLRWAVRDVVTPLRPTGESRAAVRRTAALRPEITTGLEPVTIGLVGRRRCRHAAAVRAPRTHGACRAFGSGGGGSGAARTVLAVEPVSTQQDPRPAKRVHARNSRSFVFAGDRTAKDHGPGAERADQGVAGGIASALDVRRRGRSGWRICLLSSRTLRWRSDRGLRRTSPVAAIAISQSHGWSQKIAKSRNDVATDPRRAATRSYWSQGQTDWSG